jgi:hypothetical protein
MKFFIKRKIVSPPDRTGFITTGVPRATAEERAAYDAEMQERNLGGNVRGVAPQTIDVTPMRSAIVQERRRPISEGGHYGEWMIVNDLLEVRTVGGDLVGTRRLTLGEDAEARARIMLANYRGPDNDEGFGRRIVYPKGSPTP